MLFRVVASALVAVHLALAQEDTVLLGPIATALDSTAASGSTLNIVASVITLSPDASSLAVSLTAAGSASTTLATSPRSSTSTTAQASTTLPLTSSSPTNSGTPSLTDAQKTAISTGAIVGGVLGGLAMVCVAAIIIVWILRRKPRNPKNKASRNSGFVDLPEVGAPPLYSDRRAYDEPVELDGRKVDTARELGGAPVIVELPTMKK